MECCSILYTGAFMGSRVPQLGVRSYNCLKRAGINTIGDLCSRIHSSGDLHAIRNCGKTSVAEIMDSLFAYHYLQLMPERRGKYLAQVVEINLREKLTLGGAHN